MADPTDILRHQIEELKRELEQSEADKIKAGELGMAVYEQKQELEERCEELQKILDSTRQEKDTAEKALDQYKAQHKAAAHNEIYHEERLLTETAQREEEYLSKISALEAEIKLIQPELERYKAELERITSEYAQNEKHITELEEQRKKLREDIKELRQREQSLQNDNNELEQENVALEKQVSLLKQSQVEFEAYKMEVKRLYEENQELEEARKNEEQLHTISQRQIDELTQKNKLEREERLALKKELEQMKNAEHISSLNSLLMGMNNAADDERASESLRQMESSFITDGTIDSHFTSPNAGGSDLFSEIHGGLNDKVSILEKERAELEMKNAQLQKTYAQMILPILQQLGIDGVNENIEINDLKNYMELALSRVKEQIGSGKLDKATEKRMEQQKDDLRQAILFAGARDAKLAALRDQMLLLGGLLSQSYTEIIGKGPPSDQVTQIMQNLRKIAEENGNRTSPGIDENKGEDERDTRSPRLLAIDPVNHPILSPSLLEELIPKLKTIEKAEDLFTVIDLREKLVESEDSEKLLSNLHELVNIVRNAVDATIQQQRMENLDVDVAETLKQNNKLKQLLNVKRDQVRALRQVLSTNKVSTESAMASMRDKFESEKRIKEESMDHVRKELKQLKEDAATFASHRAMYTARCEELQGTVESLMDSMKTAEEEKKTLNSLLRMAIQQKLQATQRLEDMEVDRERQSHRRTARTQPQARNDQQQQQQQQQTRAVRYPGTNQAQASNSRNNNSK
uniref:Uncharacterized protein n=1 Tax=Panagrolaimus superbus TaxID=310955 RepID=A0A914XV29_9BILA